MMRVINFTPSEKLETDLLRKEREQLASVVSDLLVKARQALKEVDPYLYKELCAAEKRLAKIEAEEAALYASESSRYRNAIGKPKPPVKTAVQPTPEERREAREEERWQTKKTTSRKKPSK